jgi:tetraacyldisaccharide 4'-kinase
MLPAGPMREPRRRLMRCDFVIVNAGDESLDVTPDVAPNAIRMTLTPGLLYALRGDESWRLSQFRGCRVNAVAGIGNPKRFFHSLQQAGLLVIPHVFPDHHPYVAADFEQLEPMLPIIMTEKDAVKCREMNLRNAWYLAIEASLPASWESAFLDKVAASVRSGSGPR